MAISTPNRPTSAPTAKQRRPIANSFSINNLKSYTCRDAPHTTCPGLAGGSIPGWQCCFRLHQIAHFGKVGTDCRITL
jgi:hypothetical protein